MHLIWRTFGRIDGQRVRVLLRLHLCQINPVSAQSQSALHTQVRLLRLISRHEIHPMPAQSLENGGLERRKKGGVVLEKGGAFCERRC